MGNWPLWLQRLRSPPTRHLEAGGAGEPVVAFSLTLRPDDGG